MAAKGWLANKSLCDLFAQNVGDERGGRRWHHRGTGLRPLTNGSHLSGALYQFSTNL